MAAEITLVGVVNSTGSMPLPTTCQIVSTTASETTRIAMVCSCLVRLRRDLLGADAILGVVGEAGQRRIVGFDGHVTPPWRSVAASRCAAGARCGRAIRQSADRHGSPRRRADGRTADRSAP